MEKINTGDIDALINRQDYKHAGLYDASGKTLVALNTNKVPLADKVKQIKKRLSGLPDGFYTLRCQHNIGKKYPAFDYVVQIGNLSEAPVMITPQANTQQPAHTEQVRGWSEALADKEKIAKLEAEVTRLKHIETYLEEEEEAEEKEENDEEGDGLSETAKVAKELVPQFLPLAEKYFEQRDRQLSLEERKLAIREKELELQAARKPVSIDKSNLKSKHPFRPVPSVNDPKIEDYVNWLKGQPDDIFNAEFDYLKTANEEVFNVCKKLLLTDE